MCILLSNDLLWYLWLLRDGGVRCAGMGRGNPPDAYTGSIILVSASSSIIRLSSKLGTGISLPSLLPLWRRIDIEDWLVVSRREGEPKEMSKSRAPEDSGCFELQSSKLSRSLLLDSLDLSGLKYSLRLLENDLNGVRLSLLEDDRKCSPSLTNFLLALELSVLLWLSFGSGSVHHKQDQ